MSLKCAQRVAGYTIGKLFLAGSVDSLPLRMSARTLKPTSRRFCQIGISMNAANLVIFFTHPNCF